MADKEEAQVSIEVVIKVNEVESGWIRINDISLSTKIRERLQERANKVRTAFDLPGTVAESTLDAIVADGLQGAILEAVDKLFPGPQRRFRQGRAERKIWDVFDSCLRSGEVITKKEFAKRCGYETRGGQEDKMLDRALRLQGHRWAKLKHEMLETRARLRGS
jgi:hypothetical protein